MQQRAWWWTRLGVAVLALALGLPGHTLAAPSGRATAPRAALNLVTPQSPRRAAAAHSLVAGSHITIVAANLPRAASTFCVGLASLIDQGGLPINLGRLRATGARAGRLETRIPPGLIGPEPPGPYLLFIGDCTTPAPMGDYGSTQITIPR